MVVLGLGGLALLMILAGGGIALTKRRVPLFYWVLGPLMVAGVSALGAWSAAGGYMGDIGAAAADAIVQTAAQGLYDSLAIEWFGRWVAALLFGVAAWAAAVGAFMAGPEGRFTPFAAGSTAILAVVGAAVTFGYATYTGVAGMQPLMLSGLILVGGLGVAISALKRAVYEHAERVASMRFVSGICLILGVSYAGRAVTMGTRMEAFGPGGIGDTAETLAQAVIMWSDVSSPASALAWMAFAFALLIGFAGFYYELGEVVDRFTLLDVWAALLVFLVVGGARTLEGWRIDNLQAVANNQPAAVIFADMGEDLPSSLLQVGDKSVNVEPVVGGFGDVYVRTDKAEWLHQLPAPAEGEAHEPTWVRAYAWDGSGWYADGTPLDKVQPSAVRPLIVMSQSDDAEELVKVVEGAGGKALLLLRGEEVKADVLVPDELIYLEVTYLPIELATDMDLKTELWATANFREVNWGPTFWYGDTESEDLVTYLDDVFADTEATGLQLLLGDKGRVKDVASGCLAAMTTIDENGKPTTNDKWCKISLGLEDEVRMAAMKDWERPAPEHTSMSFGKPTEAIAGLIGEDFMKDRLVRELGAIDYCISVARDEGEEVNGRMSLVTEFDEDGTISVELDERSRHTNFMVYRCVKDRFKKVSFTFDAEAWPKLPEPEEGEEEEEVEPLPPETLAIQLDVDYPKL
jgi:hypothetical protein